MPVPSEQLHAPSTDAVRPEQPSRIVPPERTAPPESLVGPDGFLFGTYDGPIARPDPLAAWHGPTRLAHRTRLKEWEAFQLFAPDWFALGAVYDAKLLGLLQLVVVHTPTGEIRRFEHRVPSFRLSVATGLSGTRSRGRVADLLVDVENDLDVGRLRVSASSTATDDPLRLELLGRCGLGDAGHLVICHPFPDGTPLYSHKCLMPVSGSLDLGDAAAVFEPGIATLALDDHKGHYPSPMVYDWVTAAGRDHEGRVVGFNLTANQIRDPERFNENALWIGTDVHRLGPVRFERPGGVHAPWRVTDRAGCVDISFEPSVRNEQHVGPGSFLADYYGPFGWFSGLIDTGDAELRVDGLFGMGEQKFIRF